MEGAPVVAVVGPGDATPEAVAAARAIGRLLAEHGAVVVTGGLAGVMEAAAEGARSAGGVTVGVLPGDDPSAANDAITIPLATNLGPARNAVIVGAARAVIAVGCSWGTLSEIALAANTATPVVTLGGWRILEGDRPPAGAPIEAESPAHAVSEALAAIAATDHTRLP